jgi:hypothetical protein
MTADQPPWISAYSQWQHSLSCWCWSACNADELPGTKMVRQRAQCISLDAYANQDALIRVPDIQAVLLLFDIRALIRCARRRLYPSPGTASRPDFRLGLPARQHAGNGCIAVSKPVAVEPCRHTRVHARPLVLPHHARWLLLEVVPAEPQASIVNNSTTTKAVIYMPSP